MNFAGSTCICRVPKVNLKVGVVVECAHCGESQDETDEVLSTELMLHACRVPRVCVDRLGLCLHGIHMGRVSYTE